MEGKNWVFCSTVTLQCGAKPSTHKVCEENSFSQWVDEWIYWLEGEKATGWRISKGKFIKINSTTLIFFGLMCRLVSKIRLSYFSYLCRDSLCRLIQNSLAQNIPLLLSLIYSLLHWYAYQVLEDTEASWICLWDERKWDEIICIEDSSCRHSQENCICQGSDLPYFPPMIALGEWREQKTNKS